MGTERSSELDTDEADLILRAVDRARELDADEAAAAAPGKGGVSAETPRPSRADGRVMMAESFPAGHVATGNGGERYQVMVHLDQEALGPDGALAGTLEDGSRVSAETLRRVACDCGLVAVGHDGERLDIGRRTRSIPPAIRRALMVRDKGCAFPGCTHRRFLHAHHLRHWLHGGAARMDNLVMLCTFHHHLVHEGGWTVTASMDGALVFHSPAGAALAPAPPRQGVERPLDWLRDWARDGGLDLGPWVNMPRGDGKKPDYDLAVCGLLDAVPGA
jgi:hypothetical protein